MRYLFINIDTDEIAEKRFAWTNALFAESYIIKRRSVMNVDLTHIPILVEK